MSDGFTKLFSSIVTSSIWAEDDKTRLLWITMLALADEDGYVAASVPGLANIARYTIPDTQAALDKLMQPDPYSRTKEFDGKRIDAIDGGWLILNYRMYRDRARVEARREYLKNYMRDRRKQAELTEVNAGLTSVNPSASASSSDSSSEGKVQEGEESKAPREAPGSPGICPGSSRKRLNALFKRRETTEWSAKESSALRAVMKRSGFAEELDRIEEYFKAMNADGRGQYLRHQLQTLLNNWPGELDKAANFKPSRPINNAGGYDPMRDDSPEMAMIAKITAETKARQAAELAAAKGGP